MGSDRAGLVSAIWQHDYRGVPLHQARRQMAFFPYMHVSFGAADSLSDFLNMYEHWLRDNPGQTLRIGDWVREHYFVEREGHDLEPWFDGVLYRP